MKMLARFATQYGWPYPLCYAYYFNWAVAFWFAVVAVLGFAMVFCGVAFAQAAVSTPVGDSTTGGFISLWGSRLVRSIPWSET